MKRRKTQKEEPQLYTLAQQLSSYIGHSDELGSIIGYTIVSSLINFETNAGSATEVAFEEIKAIYQGLEEAIELTAEETGYYALCELKVRSDEKLNELFDKECPEYQSPLLRTVVQTLARSSRNYQDLIRRRGIAIYSKLAARGPLDRKRNYLLADHLVVESTFS